MYAERTAGRHAEQEPAMRPGLIKPITPEMRAKSMEARRELHSRPVECAFRGNVPRKHCREMPTRRRARARLAGGDYWPGFRVPMSWSITPASSIVEGTT